MGQIQQQMKETLGRCGVPAKNIDCYGSQIVITALSRDAANKWVSVLSNFSRVRGVTESIDAAVENKGSSLLPTTIRVFRVFAVIETQQVAA